MSKSQQILCLTAAFVGGMLPCAALASSVTYTVTANTAAILGQSGYIDLQLEPGPPSSNLVTASVTNFTTNGTLTGSASLTGDASGQWPAALSFDNQTLFNDYFQPVDFGTTESFTVTLNGPTPLGASQSSFNIAFYAADGATPLLTVSPTGDAGEIFVDPNGTTTATTFASGPNAGSALTITAAVSSSVPEPADSVLIYLSFAIALALSPQWRRQRG
jgi:hypothetical protein